MPTYAALIRGIMPGNPNMRGEKLKGAFEALGFFNVKTVIGSGNVIFETKTQSKNISSLETKIEKGLADQLGFNRAVIVRSREQLERLVKSQPFKGIKDEKPNYLVVTFFKDGKSELCTVIDLAKDEATDFMRITEKVHGKGITTRTWKTVNRILAKMGGYSVAA